MAELILASGSPRRRQLLDQLGLAHRIAPADIDETPLTAEPPPDFVARMARAKAGAIARAHPQDWVLGADTAVVLEGRILGKPRDRQEGIETLLALAGRTHQVLTGIALAGVAAGYRLSVSEVRMRPIRPDEAEAYWACGEPADKAGAYAIQGYGARFVEHLSGSYSGVMGLPLFELFQLLEQAGYPAVDGFGTDRPD